MRPRLLFAAVAAAACIPGPTTTAPPAQSPCDLGGEVVYNGGPVLQSVEVSTLYWNDAIPTIRSAVDDFFTSVTQSPYIDWLSEYDHGGQSIGRGHFVAGYPLANAPTASTISDSMIQTELQTLLQNGTLTNSANALFFVFMPPNTVITDPQNRTSTGHFDGYHNSFNSQGGEVFYAVIPDPTVDAAAHGLSTLDFVTLVSSHELGEAITDPSVFNGAWYDLTLGEIGDICAWKFPPGSSEGFAVQRLWSDQMRACVQQPPPLDLDICGSVCTDTTKDSANCGGCGNVCPGREVCFDSACRADGDITGSDPCSSATLQTDPYNCGGCGNVCNGASVCAAGSCQSCQLGLFACSNVCTDPSSDPANCGSCGNACGSGQTCVGGSCSGCSGGLTACGSICTDTTQDPNNCATCGNVCPSGVCQASSCTSCTNGLTACGAICTDTTSDPNNCGECGNACDGGAACLASNCQSCPGLQTACNGSCTDTTHDPLNCGGCNQQCDPTSICSASSCVECNAALIQCSNTCVDPTMDPNNCGGCGGTCDGGQSCIQGFCEANCTGNLTACPNGCTDITSDPNNCGGCNVICDGGCVASQCG